MLSQADSLFSQLHSLKLKNDRIVGEQEEYIESLINENNKLKRRLGIADDDDIIDLDDDSDEEGDLEGAEGSDK